MLLGWLLGFLDGLWRTLLIFLPQDSCSDLISSDFLLLLEDLLADTEVLVLLIIVHFDELGDGVEDVSVEPSLLRCRQLVIKFIICGSSLTHLSPSVRKMNMTA